jgi:uncharacterized Fe-S cluster protein YjdI/CDGSH-type Zn-finger protein
MARRDYVGAGIVVHWDSDRCAHSERCFRGSPGVFDPQGRPWVDPDGAAVDEVAATIDTCPSGALSYSRTDGGEHGRRGYALGADPSAATAEDEDAATFRSHGTTGAGAEVVVTPRRNGPLVVTGPVELVEPDGTRVTESKLFLCRCGGSATKPRCDGSHKRNGFEAPGEEPPARSAR